MKVVIFEGKGYLMADSSSIRTGVSTGFKLKYGGKIAGFGGHVALEGNTTIVMMLKYSPSFSIYGKYHADVSGDAGIDTPIGCACISVGAGVDISLSYPPFRACGDVNLYFKICAIYCIKVSPTVGVCI